MVLHRAGCFLLLLLSYVVFLLLGAAVFSTLEQPHEFLLRVEVDKIWSEFLAAHPCVAEHFLNEFLSKALLARSFGVSVQRNLSGPVAKWDFVNSLFFAGTTLTTIGYGHPFPISLGGKVLCLLYSSLGIPFTFFILSISASNLLILLRDKPIQNIQHRTNISRGKLEWIHAAILVSILVVLFFFIPATVFNIVEGNWGYVDALYFCFISLTTVGLGDYVPEEQGGQKMPDLYKLSVTCYLFLGLVSVLLMAEVMKNLLKFNQVFNHFLLGAEDSRRAPEMEPVLQNDSEGLYVHPKPEETTRRRLHHSTSPTAERTYGAINLS